MALQLVPIELLGGSLGVLNILKLNKGIVYL
jgi:hypothetical protein